jgi:hypothetical protein
MELRHFVAAWHRLETALRAGNILDIFPYGARKRLVSSPERNALRPVATEVPPVATKNALAGDACATAKWGSNVPALNRLQSNF